MESTPFVYALGFLAQGLFSARILVQWIMSERARKVVSPTIFWVLSLIASYLFFIYGWLRDDFSIMLGQVIAYYVYIWNLGAKGVWKSIHRGWRQIVITVLLLTPVVGIALMAGHAQDLITRLFDNTDIPIWLILFGSLGQVIFSFRFIYQLIYSSRKGDSILPAGFWIISLTGSAIIVTYGIIRLDPVIILGQGIGFISYSRNLILWRKNNRESKSSAS
ncbi:MAG TPA: lipid-A-disaccharide synthase N-terminal domain-containing protein [Bacteroidales bacterium]|nr:lipid-A-disaccharide synthase N-terminal domain-containing protein [Bacteroidales bacterium]